ncbi:MAG TPA: hypothetical protein VF950_12865 [Planctomycetota bacterium]
MMTLSPAQPLDLFTRTDGPRGYHLYARNASLAEFATTFANEIKKLQVLVYRMPPEFLNANYWEPLTKEGENTVREKLSGIVTRGDGERVLLWRADRIAKHRLLRDGLDLPVDLLQGYVFRMSGESLIALAKAWDGKGRFEWVGISGDLGSDVHKTSLSAIHADLAQFRLSRPEEAFLYAAQGDGLVRMAFPREEAFRKALEGQLLRYATSAAPQHFARFTPRVLDQIARVGNGVGFSADPTRDVEDKGRTVEFRFALGRTPWGVTIRREPMVGDDQALLYYDQTSGIWAMAT